MSAVFDSALTPLAPQRHVHRAKILFSLFVNAPGNVKAADKKLASWVSAAVTV